MMQGSLDERVRRLEAVEAIRRLKSRYCQLCDDGYSPDALAALFTKDAVWAGGPQRGVHQGQQAIRAFSSGSALTFLLPPTLSPTR